MTAVPGMYGDIKLIAGTACPDLAAEISAYLTDTCQKDVHLLDCDIKKFSNDNIFVRLGESVRGQDVYIIQTMARPVNDKLMELLITLDAVRRDSAGRITAVIPHMSYARSDKKDLPRTPITARLVADMIQVAGADRYITIDLHAGQIQGFFTIPGDVLTAFHMLKEHVKPRISLEKLTVVTVDLGFAKGGRNWAREFDVPLAFIEKIRKEIVIETQAHSQPTQAHVLEQLKNSPEALSLIGDVKGRDVLLVDDEVDTAESLMKAINLLRREGAKEITVVFTHPVFSGKALKRLKELQGEVREFIFTNTLPFPKEEKPLPNMTIVSVAELLGEVIRRAHAGLSVGKMFDE
jgi:ribose-phosphate pyrophosphokinase